MSELPPGKSPLRAIKRISDAPHKVKEAATLLEYYLDRANKYLTDENGQPYQLMNLVCHNSKRFSNLKEVTFGVQIRNQLVHPPRSEVKLPTNAEIRRADNALIQGIEDVLASMKKEAEELSSIVKQAEQQSYWLAIVIISIAIIALLLIFFSPKPEETGVFPF